MKGGYFNNVEPEAAKNLSDKQKFAQKQKELNAFLCQELEQAIPTPPTYFMEERELRKFWNQEDSNFLDELKQNFVSQQLPPR